MPSDKAARKKQRSPESRAEETLARSTKWIGELARGRAPAWCRLTLVLPGVPYFAGLDWASEKHDLCILDAHGQVVHRDIIPHTALGRLQHPG